MKTIRLAFAKIAAFSVLSILGVGSSYSQDSNASRSSEDPDSLLTLSQWKLIEVAELAGSTITICKGTPVPSGYVIVAETVSEGCSPGGHLNAWVIKRPASSEIVCYQSPIPPTYVIKKEIQTSRTCPNYPTNNIYTIKIPAAVETVCKSSPIPSNYVVTGSTTLSGCQPGGSINAKTIQRL